MAFHFSHQCSLNEVNNLIRSLFVDCVFVLMVTEKHSDSYQNIHISHCELYHSKNYE